MERVIDLKNYSEFKLVMLECLVNTEKSMEPLTKLKLTAQINILKRLIETKDYSYFLNISELNRYIEENANIICGFQE